MSVTALTAQRIFDGEHMLSQHAVLIDGRKIVKVVPLRDVKSLKITDVGEGILAPGFVDVQVNGGGGSLLNGDPTVAGVFAMANAHRRFGTVAMLPTVITDSPVITNRAIRAVAQARAQGAAHVVGIHIEGPHLDVARKGAHDPDFIRPLTTEDASLYKANDCGTTLLTLAPNLVPPEMVADLAQAGVIVSLGHSDAKFGEVQAALDAGATCFTHLFNAMSQVSARDPGMVGAALANAESYVSIIADGHHVHDVNMKLVLKAKGVARTMLITDAMSTAAGGPAFFALQGRLVKRDGTKLVLTDGTLAGSDLTMDQALRYAVDVLGVNLTDALRMASLTPATFLRRGDELGRIKPGYLASLVHLDSTLHVKHCWVEGK